MIEHAKAARPEHKAQIDRLESRVEGLESDVSGLRGDMNAAIAKSKEEVDRLDRKIDSTTGSMAQQTAALQQTMVAIQGSLNIILSAFGLDEGPKGIEAFRRNWMWVTDTRITSANRKAIIERTVIATCAAAFCVCVLAGVKVYLFR